MRFRFHWGAGVALLYTAFALATVGVRDLRDCESGGARHRRLLPRGDAPRPANRGDGQRPSGGCLGDAGATRAAGASAVLRLAPASHRGQDGHDRPGTGRPTQSLDRVVPLAVDAEGMQRIDIADLRRRSLAREGRVGGRGPSLLLRRVGHGAPMTTLLAGLALGLAGSLHCVAMCGPLVGVMAPVFGRRLVRRRCGTRPGVSGSYVAASACSPGWSARPPGCRAGAWSVDGGGRRGAGHGAGTGRAVRPHRERMVDAATCRGRLARWPECARPIRQASALGGRRVNGALAVRSGVRGGSRRCHDARSLERRGASCSRSVSARRP